MGKLTKIALKVVGMPSGVPSPFDDLYIKEFDFEYNNGMGRAGLTPDIEDALHFDNMDEAMEFYLRQPECNPIRDDGRPNRPITATNILFDKVEVENNGEA